jgi:hypothetical protein
VPEIELGIVWFPGKHALERFLPGMLGKFIVFDQLEQFLGGILSNRMSLSRKQPDRFETGPNHPWCYSLDGIPAFTTIMDSWTRLLASTSIYTLEVPCFLGCLPQLREFPMLLGQVSTLAPDKHMPQWGTNKTGSNRIRNVHRTGTLNSGHIYRLKKTDQKTKFGN